MPAPRQPHRELGEVTDFAINRDGAAVLLRYDLVADRQPKPGALAGRLGREEGLEQLIPVLRRNASAIVAYPDLDAFAELAGRDLKCRAESAVALAATLVSGIEAIAYKVNEHASQFLRHDVDQCEIVVEVALQRDFEALILRTGTVIGEVQGLLDERVQISSLPVAAAAARVLQHASDNAVSATTVLDDLLQISGQHPDCFNNFCQFVRIVSADRLHCVLQLIEQFDREAGKVVDEIEGVLDLVRDAGGHLPERRHLLRMDQARLRRLQIAQRRLGGVSRGTGSLGTLPLRDVGIDQHEATAWHRVTAHLDDVAIGPRALEAHLPPGVFDGSAQLSFEIGRYVLAAVGEIAEIL